MTFLVIDFIFQIFPVFTVSNVLYAHVYVTLSSREKPRLHKNNPS